LAQLLAIPATENLAAAIARITGPHVPMQGLIGQLHLARSRRFDRLQVVGKALEVVALTGHKLRRGRAIARLDRLLLFPNPVEFVSGKGLNAIGCHVIRRGQTNKPHGWIDREG
jgi:nitric oxide synthase oxygenase domain/subunit